MSTKDFIEKDYYKVLGVPKDATEAEIKKAYRKLAREFHPDANKGNVKAEERFKEISEANDILGDPKKRKEYDEARALFGNGAFRPGPGAGGGSFNFDLGDLFGGGAQVEVER
ncbi:DnaJ domain-containing protein, partial [Streptomyces stelliscabiei]|uniref:DnaJ domain-containing protein n=1 Tax=Streptomyces stelliscabiei TaxID=146820 RepID=UPI00062C59D0